MFTQILASWKNEELIGIFAGVFILISFIPRREYLIRSINIVGCVLFSIYGFVNFPGDPAWSIIVINTSLAILQVVYLTIYFVNLKRNKKIGYEKENKLFDNLASKITEQNLQEELNKVKKTLLDSLQEKDDIIEKLSKKEK